MALHRPPSEIPPAAPACLAARFLHAIYQLRRSGTRARTNLVPHHHQRQQLPVLSFLEWRSGISPSHSGRLDHEAWPGRDCSRYRTGEARSGWDALRHRGPLHRLRGKIAMQVASILFAAALTFVTCLFLGKSLLKFVDAKLYRSEEMFFGFVLGAACLSTIVLLVSLAGLVYPWVFFVIGCAAFALAYRRGAIRFSTERLPPLTRPWAILFIAVYAAMKR